jgi:hypothetical protein
MYPIWPNEPAALNATRQRVITEVQYYISLNPGNNQASSPAPTGSSTIGSTTTSSAENFLVPPLLLLFFTLIFF